VKTTPLSDDDLNPVNAWVQSVQTGLNLHTAARAICIGNAGAINEISVAEDVPIRKLLEMAIAEAGGASIREPAKIRALYPAQNSSMGA